LTNFKNPNLQTLEVFQRFG